MKLDRKIAEWQAAGVIDAGTAARIAAHEGLSGQKAERPYLLYAVGGLGALSIAIGLVSIVASNWDAIPGRVKLVVDFALLVGLALAVQRVRPTAPASGSGEAPASQEGRSGWVAEVLIFVFYGLVLASIGLCSQVYHLGGATEDALLLWSAITAPIVLHGNGRLLALTWIVSLESVGMAQVERLLNHVRHREEGVVYATVAYLLSLGLVGLGQWAWFGARKPGFSSVAGVIGRVQLVALASILPLFWYDRGSADSAAGLGLICLAGVIAIGVGLALRDAGQAPAVQGSARGPLLGLAVAGPIVGYFPLAFAHESSGVPAALSFLLVWALVGLSAYRLGYYRLLNVATAVLGIRLLIIYFEVFGSLLDTGIGLLTGGVLTILLAWVWVKQRRRWAP